MDVKSAEGRNRRADGVGCNAGVQRMRAEACGGGAEDAIDAAAAGGD
jgi:hypothetical protein